MLQSDGEAYVPSLDSSSSTNTANFAFRVELDGCVVGCWAEKPHLPRQKEGESCIKAVSPIQAFTICPGFSSYEDEESFVRRCRGEDLVWAAHNRQNLFSRVPQLDATCVPCIGLRNQSIYSRQRKRGDEHGCGNGYKPLHDC